MWLPTHKQTRSTSLIVINSVLPHVTSESRSVGQIEKKDKAHFLAQLELKAKLGYCHHCHKSVCLYVCVCVWLSTKSFFSETTGPNPSKRSRTSRCALVQMILIWLALWPQKSNGQSNLWVNPHVGTGMDGWSASWNSHLVIAAGSLYLGRVKA